MEEQAPPPTEAHEDRHNARLGLWLFTLYTALYVGFIVLNAFYRESMTQLYGGVTLSVLYGFFLIVAAFSI
jgi:uncharacterized membrane protein (DUF485 family)